jgi:D-alanyl-D-alanine carboxypeptidase/D-alanyl-D-alanine-endopeptidase (penicillin-binding protein 4)
MIFRAALLALSLGAALPGHAQDAAAPAPLQQRVEAQLREAGPGVRFGLVVATEDGRELVAIAPDGRFMPASNTKLFTTAAAFATLTGLDRPDAAGGASVALETGTGAAPDVVLGGFGDARLSSAPDCVADCLAALADAVAARTRRIRDVIGDDSFYPDQRWSPGMSWNNIPTSSGTGISALTVDDNELPLRVTPAAPGRPPALDVPPYYTIDNRAVTVATGATDLGVDRLPGSNVLRLTGTIIVGAAPERLRLGIDDPAHYAAWRLRALLEARGVRATGTIRARHRLPTTLGSTTTSSSPPVERELLARLTPPPLAEDLRTINKVSQNLHAELMLRRLGRQAGTGAIADGLAVVRTMLERAGLRRADYDLSDGSGMSTYNRVTPRGVVTLLRWAGAQPWGAAWRATFPVAGVDGTLARRFRGTALESRLFAKTGSLNATAALSGYLTARSGRTLIFSVYANDIPDGASATQAMDAALVLIAEQN